MESPALPAKPYFDADELGFDPTDEVSFRSFQARHLAAQTLSAQRTEWYARSIRIMVMVWFVLFLIGLAIAVVVGIAAATSDPEPISRFSY